MPGKVRGLCARWLERVSNSRLTWRMVLLGVLGLGLAARLAQYIFNRSLWMDEAYLALNILERDLAGLLQPDQAARLESLS